MHPQQTTFVQSEPMQRDVRYRPELDGFRAVAIGLVLIGHSLAFSAGFVAAMPLAGLGVLLFFVLSGYLITRLLTAELEQNGRIDLRAFYARRALRILPALLVLLLVSCGLKLAGVVTDFTWASVLACLLFIRNLRGRGESLSHIWSLSVEEQYYAVWPAMVAIFRSKKALQLSLWTAVAIMVWRGVAIALGLFSYADGVFYLRTDFRLDAILLGAALSLATGSVSRVAIAFRRGALLLAESLNWLLVVAVLVAWTLVAEKYVAMRPYYLTIQTLLAAAVLAGLVAGHDKSAIRVVLSSPALRAVGKLSYSLYLWQQLFTVTRVPSWGSLNWMRGFPGNIIVAFVCASASYYLVEKPALRYKSRFIRVLTGMKDATGGPSHSAQGFSVADSRQVANAQVGRR